ncbi:B-cell receptor CD22-like isoform X1 [Cyprinus carpio]|uniref:B-cell receptor CD22-like isoform X1 n=1 Tax=Cyprinus carpio TaxID=7962 RepID=A0A9R0B3D2_CYPCA|nr:B-cell receptor CD22-like isoform X1 [Cyprinus carpio]
MSHTPFEKLQSIYGQCTTVISTYLPYKPFQKYIQISHCTYVVGVSIVMSVRMAPPLPLIFLIMIHGVSSGDWGVSYSPSHICALKNSSVIMSCTYTYTTGYEIEKVFWKKIPVKGKESPDLSEDPEYSQRLQYLGDKQQNCTIRLSHVTQKDQHMYCFRFITDKDDGKWIGYPGVTLTVTDLQVEAPERVTEGHNVSLTCKSSCTLTDRPTFIWYRNSQPLTERRDRNNQLLLQSVRREDAGRYSCALHGHSYISPAAHLSVTYPPKNVSISINGSGVIVEGDSVTLICSSDSNPPALNFSWFKGGTSVGSGKIYSISKISSDHSEEYKCRSINEHGEKYSEAVTLNVMYPPKNVSVSINGCGVIVEGDSVTLSCSSDSNPPALNFSWFKENQSSAVGSGQSFSALQSGRFYCEAHNQHGSQRSDAVTVTVHGRKYLYAVAGVTGGLGGFIFIFIIVLLMKKKHRPDPITQKQDDVYVNVSAHDDPLSESDPASQNDALYSLITLSNISHNQTEEKVSDSEDTEEIQYVTVLYHRNKESNQPEENESQYDNIRKYQPDAAMRSGQQVEDQSVIYSTVK